MPADLSGIRDLPRDEAFAITADFQADDHPQKVSLGAGVYRDESSKPWVLPSVKEAKKRLHEQELNHEYLPIQGSEPFLTAARELILGPAQSENTVISIQTISGTGANHLAAAFLSQHLKPKHVFFSDPTWSNHSLVWEVAAPDVVQKTYPYYLPASRSLDFEGMMSTLESTAVEDDIVVLHACAHNPTGIDPSREQWRTLAELMKRKRLFPVFDSAYQGFATGDVDADAWAVRYFQQTLFGATESEPRPQGMGIAQSFAKNFGLYGERVGAFHLVLPPRAPAAGARSQLLRLVRAEMSNAPLFGCRVVAMILSDPELRTRWKEDLQTMSGRIKRMRSILRREIEKHPKSEVGDWKHLEDQIGMFSYTGLREEQVLRLKDVHHVYLMRNGRASLSGLTEANAEYVADAIAEVMRYHPVGLK
ncbi:Aspartate aminotransferase [Aspergillus mulundensis]|uniref:Aspartate aminotransferase n=1 Tax=Aspergillus mulundensis TaxID=1810919 RepID=A0A3D8T5U0_9EURO|nr:Aspartate aminotransferase [Aspergillus mulundensis]RDW93936.1 Aspartate aminotransferase [Aspergillus mulundensis]